MSNRRTGKIARLPKEWRDVVNLMLRDGATYQQVIEKLGDHGKEINEQNVTNWKEGGYQDWLSEQERLDDMREKRDFAFEIVKQNEGSKIHEAGLNLAASQIFELLQDFDVKSLKASLAEDPENYSKVVTALARISKEALGFEKFKQVVAEQKKKIEDALNTAKSKGGLTPETLATIEQAAAML